MNMTFRWRSLGAGLLLLLLPFGGCRSGELRSEKKASVTALFSEREHKMHFCLKDLARSYTELQDSILFVEKDSKIRIKPPRTPGCEPYHAHLVQRVVGETVEQVFHQNDQGLIDIDLARYSDPESLVITSAGYEIQQEDVPARVKKADPEAKPEGAIVPPYVLSYKLLPADTASTIIPLQPFRYDIETPLGYSLHVLPTSLNRMDQIITMIDPSRRLSRLMDEDPYITIAKYDISIVPRLTLEVLGTNGKVWERTGSWHMPTGLDRYFKPGEKPFVIRSDERVLVSFAPPPEVEITLPQDVPATSARIGAKFKGFTDKDSAKLVLSCVYPSGPKGGFAATVQAHEVNHQTKEDTFTVGLEGLPAEVFPLTTSITHRLVQTWHLTGGRFEPQDPRGKVVLASIAPAKLRHGPANVIFARYASHYDFLLFFGHGAGNGRKSSLADSYYSTDDTPSSNVTPPPPGGGGNGGGDPFPPPIILPPPPGGANGAGGAGGGLGGGGNSDCGCGARGAACPSATPCHGGCGKNCRCAGGNGGNNSVTINLSCQGKEGCKHKPQCHCGPHSWSEFDCMNIIGGMTRGAAETAWFGPQGGMAPCHVSTPVARLRVTYWGVGIQRIDVWYTVNVNFGPCTPEPDKPPPVDPNDPKIPPGNPNGPAQGGGAIVHMTPIPPGIPGGLTGGDITTGTTGITNNTPVTGLVNHPYNDPNLSVQGGQVSGQLGGMGQIAAWTILSTDVFSPTIFANLLTIQSANVTAFQNAYWSGGGENAFGNVGWNPNLASQWATPMRPPPPASGPPATTGGTTSTPPPPPPGTTTGGQTGGTS